MRAHFLLPAFFAAALAAQNEFGIVAVHNGTLSLNATCTNFTTRGTLGTAAGSILVEVPGTHFNGIGQDANGATTTITGFRYLMQDQNAAAAAEIYDFEIRRQSNPPPGPDCTAAGIIFNLVGLQSPPGGSPAAFFITNTLNPPMTSLPMCDTFFMGVNVPFNAGWTNPSPTWDGLSIHMGSYYTLQTRTASNPAPNAPNIAWNCSAGLVTQPTPRTYRFYLLTNAPLLNMANEDPTLAGTGHCLNSTTTPAYLNTDTGPGGLWPESQGAGFTRNDGLKVRVQYLAAANAPFFVFIGFGTQCPGIPIPFLYSGGLFLSPALPIVQVASGILDGSGTGFPGTAIVPTIFAPGTPYPRNFTFPFQALVLSGGLIASNMAGSRFLP